MDSYPMQYALGSFEERARTVRHIHICGECGRDYYCIGCEYSSAALFDVPHTTCIKCKENANVVHQGT